MTLHQVLSNGAGQNEMLMVGRPVSVDSWSRDGRFLVYTTSDPRGKVALWALPMGGEKKPATVVESAFNARQGRISPDGRWIAYVSDETGRDEVYVQPFPAPGGKWLISGNGGKHPEWRGDGREIFFISRDRTFMSVDVAGTGDVFRAGPARALFDVPRAGSFAVTPDGQRFLVKVPANDSQSAAIHVVLNWAGELRN
jgi:Tol biopolymer transport system component